MLSDKHFLCGHASPKRFQQLFRCLCISSTSLVIPSMVTCSFRFSLCRRLTYLLSFAMLLCIYTKTVLTVYNILKPFHVCSPHQKQYLRTSKGRNVSLFKTKFFLFCQTFQFQPVSLNPICVEGQNQSSPEDELEGGSDED